MADRKGMMEIEDVLSSIRRLVAADTRSATAGAAPEAADAAERLVLTPAQRIDEDEAAAAQPAEAPEIPDPVRAWDEDSRAERGAAEDPPEDIEATLAALEAALDDDLAAGDVPEPEAARDDDFASAEAPDPEAARDDDFATAEAPEPEAALDDDFATAEAPEPTGDDAARAEQAGPPARDDPAGEDTPTDATEVAGAAEPMPAADRSTAEPDAGAAALPGQAPMLIRAEDFAGGMADDGDGTTAAPAPRGPLRGFIWEAGFEDGAGADLPPVPEALGRDPDDAGPQADWADAGLADAAETGGWAPAEDDAADAWDAAEVAGTEPDAAEREAGLPDPDLPPDAAPAPGDAPPDDLAADVAADALPDAPEVAAAPAEHVAEPPRAFADTAAGADAQPAPPAPAAGLLPDPVPEDEPEDFAGLGLFDGDETLPLDEAALRDLVAEIIRDELRGALGARIARSLRQMVRQEIARELAARGLPDDS